MAGYFVICLLCRNVEPTMAQERIAAARSSPLQEHMLHKKCIQYLSPFPPQVPQVESYFVGNIQCTVTL